MDKSTIAAATKAYVLSYAALDVGMPTAEDALALSRIMDQAAGILNRNGISPATVLPGT